jgi:FixJ family two-component response regulator
MQSIVVVDDSSEICRLVQLGLAPYGYHVCTAEPGPGMADDLRRRNYGLLITDLHMDGVAGGAVAAASRATHPRVPIIGMTGALPEPAETACYDAMLLKPFTMAAAASLVGRFLPASSPRQSNQTTDPVIADVSIDAFAAQLRARESALFAYWLGKREGVAVPRRASIDPADMPTLLPNLQLHMQLPDGRFHCRLSGTAITRLFGFDATGRCTDELPLARGAREPLFARVIARGAPLLYRSHVTVPGREWRTYRRLMLPLRHGDTVNMVLSHLEPCISFAEAPATKTDFELLEGWELTQL